VAESTRDGYLSLAKAGIVFSDRTKTLLGKPAATLASFVFGRWHRVRDNAYEKLS
jgi:hypothetical protein